MTRNFEFHADLPVLEDGGLRATVIMGELAGARSPRQIYSPLAGVDVELTAGADRLLPLEPDFEYAMLTADGVDEVDGVELAPGSLLCLGCGRSDLRPRASTRSRTLLLGGEPFEEKIVMWWNFVALTSEEVKAARDGWMTGDDFGTVHGYQGDRLSAPSLPATPLVPRGRER